MLSSDQTHHLHRLIRLKAGDSCLLVDPLGAEGEARIERFLESGQTLLKLIDKQPRKVSGKRLFLSAYVALPQRGKGDELVEKGQELGLDEIHFLETERTVVKMTGANKGKAFLRWQKIAEESAKQSGAFPFIHITPPLPLREALSALSGEQAVLFHPDPAALPFSQWAPALTPGSKLNFFIGPEGGFSPKELALFKAAGRPVLRLGDSTLKTETAFLGIVSSLRFLYP